MRVCAPLPLREVGERQFITEGLESLWKKAGGPFLDAWMAERLHDVLCCFYYPLQGLVV